MSEWNLKEQAGIIYYTDEETGSTPGYRVSKRYDMGVHDLAVELQTVYYHGLGQCLAYKVSTI